MCLSYVPADKNANVVLKNPPMFVLLCFSACIFVSKETKYQEKLFGIITSRNGPL